MGQINLFRQDEEEKPKGKKKSFSEEKNLFGLTPQTEESIIRNDYKPKYFLSDTDDYVEALITNVKVTLLKAGLDRKAREFIDRVYKGKNENLFQIIEDYVILVKPTPVNLTEKQKKKQDGGKKKSKQSLYFSDNNNFYDYFNIIKNLTMREIAELPTHIQESTNTLHKYEDFQQLLTLHNIDFNKEDYLDLTLVELNNFMRKVTTKAKEVLVYQFNGGNFKLNPNSKKWFIEFDSKPSYSRLQELKYNNFRLNKNIWSRSTDGFTLSDFKTKLYLEVY